MHHLASLLSKCSKQFQLPKHRFKQRQNASTCFLAFTFFKAAPSSKTSFKNIRLYLFLLVFSNSNLKNVASNSVRMQQFVSLIQKCSQLFQLQRKYVLVASECTTNCPCFQHVLIIFNFQTSFKLRKNVPFSVFSFKTF